MQVIGLDVGTSGVKSTVFDERANVLGHAYREYDLISEGEGWYELDPNVLLRESMAVLKQSIAACGADDVAALCVTSFAESFVCLDEGGRVLSNTMIYMDVRGTEECEEYRSWVDERAAFDLSGQQIDPMYTIFKMRWMAKHKPEVLNKTRRVHFIADFIAASLGAARKCDYSLAARSALFDIRGKRWIPDAVAFAGIDLEALPEPVPGGSVVGRLGERPAAALGLKPGVKLILGGHDQIMAAVGGGARAVGDVSNGMGTVDCITAIIDIDQMDLDKMFGYNFPIVPFLDTGLYVTYAFNMSGGCAVKWFRDTLAKDIAGLGDAYARLNAEAPDEPTGLYVLPYLAGAGTPYRDADTPCVVAGLRLGTSRGKLFRAFLEGESYELKLSIECLYDAGIAIEKIITVGGGSNSPLWMQIRADIFARPIYLPANKEAGTLASALMCYAQVGLAESVAAAQEQWISYDTILTPGRWSEVYRSGYERYLNLYDAARELYR